ncbi:alpha-amylase family glycosyl hydrolase [Vibrio mediterranei]|uniref:Sugar phosphorylase n=1 Tax=Vibrio mediterranei TaxID=689 RepID=A0ABX5DGD9_9VIBR|nr:alpha-amylase family glycosyl hydrolase [Vibrio mediterranei]PCD89042.1 sugar phosphorylase [Vibrio mediterranei]PRQ68617.1 sugar phosphorylase [Vibrio mediterranei]PTC06569.1 sugar phosphorylase [Vibrio mediterranei]
MAQEQTANSQVKKDLQQILAGVYSPAQLNELIPNLLNVIANQPEYVGKKQWVDQNDIMLITYGDSIKKQGEAPLHTLREFLNDNAADVLSAVHILPCYPYTSDDGFSVVDYWKINPELGDWQDVQSLSNNYDLMFDGVINHISKSSDWFQGYLKGEAQYREFFTEANPNRDYSSVTRPRALPLLTTFETAHGTKHIWTTFSEDQIDLNFRCPEVFQKIAELLLFYAQQGASFIRLDAIGFMWKELDTPCIHQPQTHAIVQALRALMSAVAPHVKLITETNVPHNDNISYFGNGENEAHLVYQFPLPPLTLHTLQTGNSEKIVEWMSSLEPCSEQTTFFNFLASHDGIGVRPVEGILNKEQVDHLLSVVQTNGGRVSYKDNGDGTQSPYELNINYFDAIRDANSDDQTNLDRFMAAQSILISMAGVPGIYVHSLLGSGNDVEGLERLGYNRAINREKLERTEVETELANPESRRAQVLSRFKHILGIRKQQRAFAPSASQRVVATSEQLVTFVRDEQVLVAINISNQAVELDTNAVLKGVSHDLISGNDLSCVVTVQPYQVMWLAK